MRSSLFAIIIAILTFTICATVAKSLFACGWPFIVVLPVACIIGVGIGAIIAFIDEQIGE